MIYDKNSLLLPPKINIYSPVVEKQLKNAINAELRIDGDFYPCPF
jgi:hypothetical protein